MPPLRKLLLWTGGLLLLAVAVFLLFPKEDQIRLLYATNGERYDRSAFGSLQQSAVANLRVTKASLDSLSLNQLNKFDAIYLDVGLNDSDLLKKARADLQKYVSRGGHLFLENDFADDFPADFLGAAQVVDVPATANPSFVYPEVGANLQGMQEVFRRFSGNFLKHAGMDSMPGFRFGKGIVPSTAETLVSLDNVSLYTVNRSGRGTVFLAGTLLPNRYFITGFDLQSGMDISQGFTELIARQRQAHAQKTANAAYFDRTQIPLEPYFNFAFAAANTLFRTEYVSYVSKEKYGYSVKKIFGPYGRPAMAYENHFEALPAFRNREGIQWAEMLKRYNEIPSFSLVRSSYDWGKWYESIVVQLNAGTTAAPKFAGELPNSFYSSGAHLMSDGKLLRLAAYPDYKSLGDPVELPYRAYPAIADLDGDGTPELLAGSADGYVYRYRSLGARPDVTAGQPVPDGLAPPDAFAPPDKLLQTDGKPLTAGAGGYAAIAVADVNGDGLPDLLAGGADGAVRVAVNAGSLRFAPPVPLADADGRPVRVPSHAAPAVGDVDGDGTPDLVVGDADGAVHLFRGVVRSGARPAAGAASGGAGARTAGGTAGMAAAPGAAVPALPAVDKDRVLFRIPAKYAAPAIKDMNGDGTPDLLIGNNEGDLLVYVQQNGEWKPDGPLEGDTVNQLGTKAIVGGHNSVPLWYDINHDGKDDLLVGQLEFGLPFTIDDPNFPYKQQLREFIDYCQANGIELYPHLFFHNYESEDQEKQEIELHRQAFAKLGIPWNEPGTNQHTWRVNNTDRLQTLRDEAEYGIWFNFGFQPPRAPNTPSWGTDYIWGLPFLLDDPGLSHPMVLHTPAPLFRPSGPSANTDIYESFAALDMPIDYFEHIEYHFPERVGELEQFAEYLDKLRTAEDYNFMTEPQMARSFLTALTSKVTVSETWGTYLWNKFKDAVGKGTHFSRTIRTEASSVPKQAAEYAGTLGVVVEPGEKLGQNPLRSTSDIFVKKGVDLYTAVAGKTGISIDWSPEPLHIVRANVPVEVHKAKDRWSIDLNAAGMQQIKLYSPTPLAIEGRDLKVDHDEQQHTYTVTHYGDKTSIIVKIER